MIVEHGICFGFVAEHVFSQGLSPWLLQLFLFTVSVQASFLLRQVSEDIHIELTSLVGVAVPHSWADDGHNHETDSDASSCKIVVCLRLLKYAHI